MSSCSPSASPRRRAKRRPPGRSRRPPRAADSGGLRRAARRKPALAGRAPQERHLARRHDRRGAVGADGRRRPAAAPRRAPSKRRRSARSSSAKSSAPQRSIVSGPVGFSSSISFAALRKHLGDAPLLVGRCAELAGERRLQRAARLVQFRNRRRECRGHVRVPRRAFEPVAAPGQGDRRSTRCARGSRRPHSRFSSR